MNPEELGTNRDKNRGMQYNLTPGYTPEKKPSSFGSFFSNAFNGGRFTGLDTNQMSLIDLTGLEGIDLTNALKQNEMINSQNALGQFDYSGAFDMGMSAFNDINKYNYQKDVLDIYKGEAAARNAEIARKNNTRSAWANAYN